jgi:hypothetical protein
VKRRKFATAAAFAVALLVAALAAASVSAATSSHKSTAVAGKGYKQGPGHTGKHGNSTPQMVGTGQFASAGASPPVVVSRGNGTPANLKSQLAHDRGIPGKLHGKGGASPNVGATPNAPFIPHAHSLPIGTRGAAAAAKGLNEFNQESAGGYPLSPPDEALAEGNGFVFQAVNNVFQITDTNFGHVTNAEPMEQFWAPAILATGACFISDPKAHYDTVTRKWYVTEAATQFLCGGGPGSDVFIAVSTTSDPLSIYNIYVLDTSFDGSVCGPDGCLGDQPLLGMNRNALFISTNSFDWDSNAFNGTQMYIIDSTALAFGALFPNIVYIDIGGNVPTPEGVIGCGGLVYPANAYCWASVQPATSPNLTQTTEHNGTEFGLSSLDWFGSVDNRVALWGFTNTTSINRTGNCSTGGVCIDYNYAIANTESYGYPITDTPFFSPYAEQPSSGNTPFCDIVVGPLCEPGPIANNDDRMNEVKSVKTASHAAHNWAGVNTDALVPDPIGHLRRRSAIAYFDISATAWLGPFVVGAGVNAQGYVANWNNDVIFPAIGVGPDGTSGAMVYTLTGNTNFPSVAVSNVSDISPVSKIPVVLAGKDVLDDAAWYLSGTPRFGDYSAAVGDGHTVYLGAEYVQDACDTNTYLSDLSFGVFPCTSLGTPRGVFSNWGTGLVKVNL